MSTRKTNGGSALTVEAHRAHIGDGVFTRHESEAGERVALTEGYRTHRYGVVPPVTMREGETIAAILMHGDAENLSRWAVGDDRDAIAAALREWGREEAARLVLAL